MGNGFPLRVLIKSCGDHVVTGKNELVAGTVEDFACELELVFLDERFARLDSFGAEKGISHAAADEEPVDLGQEVVDDFDLVRDLGSTQQAGKRVRRDRKEPCRDNGALSP